jgi:heme/copper-type cytochrome/quinol oxidase subunit 2
MWWKLPLFIALIVFLAYFVNKARQKPDILKIGTFIVLTLTLFFLAIYTFDTNRLSELTQKRWERESILSATYGMEVTDNKGGKGRTGFVIVNPSNLMLWAKVWCNFKVYGTSVDYADAYNGKETWCILPGSRTNGWYDIETLLKKRGETVKKMISDYSEENRDNQLTLDLKIDFLNEIGDKRSLPSMKYYFAFNEWKWIPIVTGKKDW